MNIRTQKQQAKAPRGFSKKDFGQYFFPKRVSKGLIAITIAGALVGLVGFIWVVTKGISPYTVIFALMGGMAFLVGSYNIRAILRSNPSGADYDNWLEDQAEAMYPKALRILNLRESQITSQVLRMHSVILPGSSESANYHDNVYLKQGKDGQWRSSVNLYTYFFPTERFIAMFTRSINIFDPIIPFDDTTEEFFYRDIVSVSFSVFQDTVIFGEREILYRVQQCSFKISSGDDIGLGAYLSAVPMDRSLRAPVIILKDTDINQTLGDLRALLRVKKQRGR